MLSQYGGLWRAVKVYWNDYGGWRDLFQSPMFHMSVLIATLASLGMISIEWRVLTTSMMPTILGFSLAAYAITFALMGSKLHIALSDAVDGTGRPLSRSVNATLFHNVFIQASCLSFAVITKGTLISLVLVQLLGRKGAVSFIEMEHRIGEWLGLFLLVYAITLLFSSAIAMFRLGRLVPVKRNVPVPANDRKELEETKSAQELYGVRWALIRAFAKLLRVNG